MAITSFSGEYRFLSNFWLHEIEFRGIKFPATENAYQASKFWHHGPEFIEPFTKNKPGEAKRLARDYAQDHGIGANFHATKNRIMTKLQFSKFKDPELKKMLLTTGEEELIEGNTWNDRYWGQCPIGMGENRLGKILMAVRFYHTLADYLPED